MPSFALGSFGAGSPRALSANRLRFGAILNQLKLSQGAMPQDTLLSDASSQDTLVRDASSYDNRASDASSKDIFARDVAQYTLVLDAI